MKKIIIWSKTDIFIILILLLTLLLRIIWLDKFPTGITTDELSFVLNSKAIYLWGTNLAHNWNPLSFTPIPNETSSELTYIVILPFIGPFPLSLFYARLPFVIIGVLTNLIIYLLTKKLINKPVALLSSLIVATNPWNIYVARTSFDGPVALLFFLIALLMMVSLKGWKILLCFIPLALAFYTYIGTKIIFPLFVLISIFYCFKYVSNKKYLKQYLILLFLSLALVIQYTIFINVQKSSSRVSEFAIFNSESINSQVNDNRRLSINSPFNKILNNKATVIITNFTTKYINSFSTELLFTNGDNTAKVTLMELGYFYYISLIFLIVGLITMSKKYPKVFALLIGILIISPLPEALRSDQLPAYAFHSLLEYPILAILIGYGLTSIIIYLKNKPFNKLYYLVISAVMFIQLLNFMDIYFLRYPVYNSEAFNFSTREVSHYINLEQADNKQIYFVTSEPQNLFKSYIFYNNLLNKNNIQTVSDVYNQDQDKGLQFNNIHFVHNIDGLDITPDKTIIIQSTTGKILNNLSRISIAQLSDGGEIFAIYNGTTCSNLSLNRYPENYKFNDFNIESLSLDQFCQKFITKLN